MQNTNYESFYNSNKSSSSISTDSLERSTKSIIREEEDSKSIIQEESNEQNLSNMKKNSNKFQHTADLKITKRQRIPIRKRSCTHLATCSSNSENANTNAKVNQETNTAIPVYPEITVKHCHNDKAIEKVIPAVDGPRIMKPKTYIEIVRHGDKNGKLNILPIGKNKKSYLEIFQSRHGIRTPTGSGNRSRIDDMPRNYGDANFKKHNYNDSLYSKDLKEKEPQIRYPSHASSLYTESTLSANSPDSHSSTSSAVLHTSSGLSSISEQILSVRERTSQAPRILSPANNKKIGLKITKSESVSTKEKFQNFIRQREYGQTASNRNRIKIIQNHIRNSDCKPVTKELTPSKSCKIKKEELSSKIYQEKKKNVKQVDNVKMVDIPIGTDDIGHTVKMEQNPRNPKSDRRKNSTPINIINQHGNIKTLQQRHLKEQGIVAKLRSTTL